MNRSIGIMGVAMLSMLVGSAMAAGGGYNWKANIFVGTGAEWCLQSGYGESCVSGLGSSANDLVIMKWNAQWNICNLQGESNASACVGAWENNEWIGTVPGGDGGVWHYKIIWVGPGSNSSAYWVPGGESVWGNYEILMDQGTELQNGTIMHVVNAIAKPDGYGTVK